MAQNGRVARPPRVNYTPVMMKRIQAAARATKNSPAFKKGAKAAKDGAVEVAEGLVQDLGEGQVKQQGKQFLKKFQNPTTPPRPAKMPEGVSPLDLRKPIRTPNSSRRQNWKLKIAEQQRRLEEELKRIEIESKKEKD